MFNILVPPYHIGHNYSIENVLHIPREQTFQFHSQHATNVLERIWKTWLTDTTSEGESVKLFWNLAEVYGKIRKTSEGGSSN
jgi:hypothetical protein